MRRLLNTTGVSGGEKFVALSSSSARMWTRSPITWPTRVASGAASSRIRWSCSTSDIAARSTSPSGAGDVLGLAASVPARTSRFWLLRRMRTARWSSWTRFGQLVGVLLVVLQLLDELQLPVDQTRAAPRQVGEHAVDARLQGGLVGGQPHGLSVHHVERAGHLPHLVAAVQRHRFDGDVRRTPRPHGCAPPAAGARRRCRARTRAAGAASRSATASRTRRPMR